MKNISSIASVVLLIFSLLYVSPEQVNAKTMSNAVNEQQVNQENYIADQDEANENDFVSKEPALQTDENESIRVNNEEKSSESNMEETEQSVHNSNEKSNSGEFNNESNSVQTELNSDEKQEQPSEPNDEQYTEQSVDDKVEHVKPKQDTMKSYENSNVDMEFSKDEISAQDDVEEEKINHQENNIEDPKSTTDTQLLELKDKLNDLGFSFSSDSTNNIDALITDSLKEFQKSFGLPITGKVDEETLQKMEEILLSPFQNGKSHPETVRLKELLHELGLASFDNTNDYYGTKTKKAIEEFQKQYGLAVTGIADVQTMTLIELEANNKPLSKGMRDEDTIRLKENLNKLGFTSFKSPNNYFGTKTEKGIKAFQKHYGLPVTGVADEETLSKMEVVLSSPMQRGKSHADTIDLKKKLTILGYENFPNPTKYYGVRTENAIKQFQKDMCLPVSGIVDQATIELLEEQASKPLSKGMRRTDAVELKQNLNRLGFASFKNPNNYFGTKSEKGIKAFQKHYGLPVTGVVDEETLSKMEEVLSSPLQRGKSHADAIELKKKLTYLGYESFSNPTKYYGVRTETAIKQFQKDMGLPVSGIVDQTTMKLLKEQVNTPLSKGMRRADAIELKLNLNKLGFASFKNPNNYFGNKTEKGIKAFQKHYSLSITGVADIETLNKIEEILSSPFQYGKRHSETIQLKKNLDRLGFASFNNPNNYFGKKTRKGIEGFQRYYGLPVSGIADDPTRSKIQEVLSSPYQYGKRHKDNIAIKKKLDRIGYSSFKNPNNYFGKKTRKGIIAFQRDHGLPVSGIADEKTLLALNQAANKAVKIFLDPGHGGNDPGAIGYGLREKDVVLDIALKTADVLRSQFLGVEVKLSRIVDKTLSLAQRTKMANDWKADYFVSFHTNAFNNGTANGFETYIYNGNVSKETRDKQKDIHNYLAKRIKAGNRGAKEANFHVLRESTMPAILIEYLFITNPVENHLLKQASYRAQLGTWTAYAIAESFSLKKR